MSNIKQYLWRLLDIMWALFEVAITGIPFFLILSLISPFLSAEQKKQFGIPLVVFIFTLLYPVTKFLFRGTSKFIKDKADWPPEKDPDD